MLPLKSSRRSWGDTPAVAVGAALAADIDRSSSEEEEGEEEEEEEEEEEGRATASSTLGMDVRPPRGGMVGCFHAWVRRGEGWPQR
jgi:hypothetical protein